MWGRIRRSTEAARANLFAQEYVRRGVMLSLVSDVAASYFSLLELDRELAIAQESLAPTNRLSIFSLSAISSARTASCPWLALRLLTIPVSRVLQV